MKSNEFCRDISKELNSWCSSFQNSICEFDQAASIDKYKLTNQIGGLHILLAELQEKIAEIESMCPIDENYSASRKSDDIVGEPRYLFKESSGVNYDYDFGG